MAKPLFIKVSDMCDLENNRIVNGCYADMEEFDFRRDSEHCVKQLPTYAGILPDAPSVSAESITAKRVGAFVDDMPQTIVTRVYNYHLDYVLLEGSESAIMIDNLRRTLVPDIVPQIGIIKTINLSQPDDFCLWREYSEYVDMFLFRIDGDVVGDIEQLKTFINKTK